MKTIQGKLLVAIGILHCAVGLAFGQGTLAAIVSDGWVNAVEPHVGRMYWFWFMMTGLLLIVVGQLAQTLEDSTGELPAYLGWEITLLGVVATAAIPASGGWLVVGAGVYMLVRSSRPRPER